MRRGRFRIGIITVVDSADTKRYTVHKSGGTSGFLEILLLMKYSQEEVRSRYRRLHKAE